MKRLLTSTERHNWKIRGTKEAWVDSIYLTIGDTNQLRIDRCSLTVQGGRNDTQDIDRVPGVAPIPEREGNQCVPVHNPWRLRKRDHSISNVLLGARIGVREEGVDTADTSELDTRRVLNEDVSPAGEAECLPLNSEVREVQLGKACGKATTAGSIGIRGVGSIRCG